MTEQTDNSPTIDLALLAKLTGGLGDYKTVEKICSEFGQLYAEFLPDVFHSETGFPIAITYTGFQSGLMEDLLRELGPTSRLPTAPFATGLRTSCWGVATPS